MLSQIDEALGHDDPGKLSPSELRERRRLLRAALDRVSALKLKPAKGRRRDLKAVEQLARELRAKLVDA